MNRVSSDRIRRMFYMAYRNARAERQRRDLLEDYGNSRANDLFTAAHAGTWGVYGADRQDRFHCAVMAAAVAEMGHDIRSRRQMPVLTSLFWQHRKGLFERNAPW